MLDPSEFKPQGDSEWLEKFGIALTDRVSCDTLDCTSAATHWFKVNCCGAVLISCKPCLDKALKAVIWMHKNSKMFVCDSCGKPSAAAGSITRPQEL